MSGSSVSRAIMLGCAIVTVSFVPRPARAQQPAPAAPAVVKSEPAVSSTDSATIADVHRAAEQLAIAVQEVVRKTTESPELKVAALKLATHAVKAAEVVVAQQSITLQTILESLAREIAVATAKVPKAKTP